MTPPQPPLDDADDLLAAEYVLGVLSIDERIGAENRARRDAGFADAMAAWELRLAGLNENFHEIKAPNLLPRLEERLFGKPEPRPPFWRNWFLGAGSAAALAIAVLAFLPMTTPPPGTAPQHLATLSAEAGSLRYDIGLEGDELHIIRVAGEAAEAGRVHELWLIAGEAAPVSLGLIGTEPTVLPASGLAPGVVLAVSLEPEGGAPGGAPTGPVLVTGVVEDL
ncbi:anti-sigma factor [Szabonella alba]|uniref:Anti-sigma factor n=1 Tax=Szabonella alba TaxID=2804194 RepID=A0A8K0V7T8_9RHOB|nr:anti-sigma factor [Szabonella alba]MBL4917319.1 anti-sigma factor [Szabonella alba]